MFRLYALCAMFLLGLSNAQAACSRPIVIPAGPLGRLITTDANGVIVGGIYPDLLRARGSRAGCEFVFTVVPRVRADLVMRQGDGDMLLEAVRSPDRDEWGNFVPMLGSAWVLIGIGSGTPPHSVQELLDAPNLKFNAVRGYNGGPAYLQMIAELERRGALEYVKDARTVVRKMQAGRAEYTVMASSTFLSALADEGGRASFGDRLHFSRLDGIPSVAIGVYLSKRLPAGDAAQLTTMLQAIRDSGDLMAALRQNFSPDEMRSIFTLPAQ